jgi:hypothetical protein
MRVKEWDGEVIFLHEVGPGAADRSYGIQVARLAGLPALKAAMRRFSDDDWSKKGHSQQAFRNTSYRYYSGMTSRDKSVIPPEIMAKLADIGASLENGSSPLSPKDVLDGLSRLPAHTATHVSRSIQIGASLFARSPSTRFLLISPFRSRLSEADLMRFDPAYAWLFSVS